MGDSVFTEEIMVSLHEESAIRYENCRKSLRQASSAVVEDNGQDQRHGIPEACALLAARAEYLSLMKEFSRIDASLEGNFRSLRDHLIEESLYSGETQQWEKLAAEIGPMTAKSDPQTDHVPVDVDAFFEEYPHCSRPNWEEDVIYEDDDSTSDHDSVRILEPKPVAKATHVASPRQKANPPPTGNPGQFHNPYAVHAPQQKPDSSFSNIERQRGTSSSVSWEEHESSNPFQTAREYAKIESKETGKAQPSRTQQHSESTGTQHNSMHNPYDKSVMVSSSPPPPMPIIRDSLKRKFRPPQKGTQSSSNTTNRGQTVATQKPPTTDQNEDEDELPEELKRFGKELVEKIESEIMDCGEPVRFDDIAGLDDAKQTIQEVICWPMKRPDLFTGLRRAPNGLLLYGPPGTGKTLIGKAIAHESGATFFSISSSSLTSKWIGEGEKLVRTMFAVAAYREPAVVFIDEIDSLLTQRKADENEASRRIKTEFLVQLDGTGTAGQGRVLVIGATNRPQELDEAARRRFVKRLYIPLPETSDRKALLEVLLSTNHHCLRDEDIEKLAHDTDGFSGADLKALCADAAMGPIRQLGTKALEVKVSEVPPISYKHFKKSLRGTKPSVAQSDLDQYIQWEKLYGSSRSNQEDEDSDDDQ